jgi:Uma2 family endonuclease
LSQGLTGPFGFFQGWFAFRNVAFASWSCFPQAKRPKARIPQIAPNLVVEVPSKGNTKTEITKKLGEYFDAGVRLVWIVVFRKQTVRAYTSRDESVLFQRGDVLDGGAVLQGFTLRLDELFAQDR